MVSVVIVAYNHEKYIRKAIQSVLMQQMDFPIEILVGDDCSDDGTAQVILEMADSAEIVPIIRKKNMGATRNLYELQARARGKYIAYLDGDDYWCDDKKLQKQINFLEEHPQFVGCSHRCRLVDFRGVPLKNQDLDWICNKDVYTISDFKGLMLPGHESTLVHRNVFLDSNGAYEEIMTLHPLIGDRSLCLLLASFGPVKRLNEIMSCYRCPDSNRKSATVIAYSDNSEYILDDYEYTLKLENYATNKLGVDGKFEDRKKNLFVSAVWNILRHPTRSKAKTALKILRDGNAVEYLLFLPIGSVRKVYHRLKREVWIHA